MRPRVLPCGTEALLLDCGDLAGAQAWRATLTDHPDVRDVVLGARTVLLRGDPARLRRLVAESDPGPGRGIAVDAPSVVVPVVYDGEDLEAVAAHTGLTTAEVVEAHTGRAWTVAFGGFAPGFAYLVDGDPRLEVPRLPRPRTRVPAGSVGLAGTFSGIYPRESPGGWQLLGHTDLALFDVGRV
ncbi:MAG: allophanate hydrolase subunit 1, partial [Actinomycetales bacterium]